jgi:phosphoglycerol transferase MdoB-like AlkP superfamily enzyme
MTLFESIVRSTVGVSRRVRATAICWAIVSVAMLALGFHFVLNEASFGNIILSLSLSSTIGAILLLISRRILFSTVVVVAFLLLVVAVASAKQREMGMSLHAYDVAFYLTSVSTIEFLWSGYRHYIVLLAAALVGTTAVGWIAFRIDRTRVSRRCAAAMALSLVSISALVALNQETRPEIQAWRPSYISNFYSSWGDVAHMLWRGHLIEAQSASRGRTLKIPARCEVAAKPPHIILIHQESAMPPSVFPTIAYDKSLDPMFRSHDDNLHLMRVEVWSGGSWLTQFSVLTGLSANAFGSLKAFAHVLLANRIRDTLPDALARCGYRSILLNSDQRNFVSTEKFFAGIGFSETYDMSDQGAKVWMEPDHFYYKNALYLMNNHFGTSEQPLFIFIVTTAAHGPYNFTFKPEVIVPGGGRDPEMNEYLRRLSMKRMDYEWLLGELRRRYPGERFLIVQYGDHQPYVTRSLLELEGDTLPPESKGFVTYYAVNGINYSPPAPPNLGTVDVAYLGTIVLDAARLPLSDSYRERKRLMVLCEGRYFGCSKVDAIPAFHRRLIDSGLLDVR